MNLNSISTNLSRVYGLVSDDPFRLQSRSGNSVADSTGVGSPSSKVRLSDYGRLQSSLAELRRATGSLDKPDEVVAYKATPSADNVAASAGTQVQQAQVLRVDVTQLARGQKLQSQTFADSATTQLGGGTLRIDFGRLNTADNSFTATNGSARSISIRSDDSSLDSIAGSINRAGIGISAKVTKDNNDQYRLELSGQTGANQAFRITVSDTDGNNTDSTQGLSRLAFDPSSPSAAGKNLNLQQAAQDAEATVDDKRLSSSNNTFNNVVPGISFSATAVGKADVTISRDAVQAGKSAKALVAAFNRFREQAEQLGSDGLTRKISGDIDKALTSAETGAGQNRLKLADLGISKGTDGRLAVDEDKFKQAFARNAEGATSLLASAADRLGSASESSQNGVLRKTSSSLQSSLAYSQQNNLAASLSSYRQTTSNLYGLAQYLSIARLQ